MCYVVHLNRLTYLLTREPIHVCFYMPYRFQTFYFNSNSLNTDVVVIAAASFSQLNVTSLWIGFGASKHFRYIAIHELVNILGPEKSQTLPLFHALTGCDTVSGEKKSAYKTWSIVPNPTDAFLEIINNPDAISESFQQILVIL